MKVLGFTFYTKTKSEVMIIPHQKSRIKFKEKVRELLKRNKGMNIELVISRLNLFLIGWVNYYAISQMKAFIDEMTGWIRRKIRVYIWKQWKKIKTRFNNLKKLGIDKNKAWGSMQTQEKDYGEYPIAQS